ncbi:MAG: hypothetical protein H0W25_12120 [Acidimicrobiia bacterium]|nr:hypothetical protein [Acidimicrobiia bacterium]
MDDRATSEGETMPRRRALLELTPEAAERFRDPRVVIGFVLIAAGAVALIAGYFGVSATLDPGKQLPFIISGGIGGVFLLGAGAAVLFSSELAALRTQNRELRELVIHLKEDIGGLRDGLLSDVALEHLPADELGGAENGADTTQGRRKRPAG